MARLVSIIGTTHNPFMPRLFAQPTRPPVCALVEERLAMLRERLERAAPDVVLAIGNDHLNQFFMDNMPAFLIGKMERYAGTFYNEEREFGLPRCELKGDAALARGLLEGALDHGVDVAYSDELRIDHSIVVPLLWLRPALDLPIVPLLTNCIAPPLPRPRRFYQVGQLLRAVLDQLPGDQRVAAVVSGHLSLEIGGPRQMEPRLVDPAFDRRAVGWLARGDLDEACANSGFDQLKRSGNMTHGFLNFLLAAGLANGQPAAHAEGMEVGFPAVPMFAWEPEGAA